LLFYVIGNIVSYYIKKQGVQRDSPSADEEGAQAAMLPPKGTRGFPSGVASATFLPLVFKPSALFCIFPVFAGKNNPD
jgi:hypothetical protein